MSHKASFTARKLNCTELNWTDLTRTQRRIWVGSFHGLGWSGSGWVDCWQLSWIGLCWILEFSDTVMGWVRRLREIRTSCMTAFYTKNIKLMKEIWQELQHFKIFHLLLMIKIPKRWNYAIILGWNLSKTVYHVFWHTRNKYRCFNY